VADGRLAAVPAEMLEACRVASVVMGGPRLRRIGVTSALREEGRTSVALAMAAVQRAEFGRDVVLVDMDFQKPSLADRLGVESTPGLTDLSRGEVDFDDVLRPVSEGVWLVTAGRVGDGPSREIIDIVTSGLVIQLGNRVDVVVADLPPLLGAGLGQVAARAFDDVVLVVRAGVTPVARVKEAADDLHVEPNVLLNGAYSSIPRWLRRLLGQ
jgi:Mrp family chromosome partitioning ATPase